jgi:hypothetical protein
VSACQDGCELPDARADTVAESLRDLAAGTGRERHHPTIDCRPAAMAQGMQAVADILGDLIPLWDFEPRGRAAVFAAQRDGCCPGKEVARPNSVLTPF